MNNHIKSVFALGAGLVLLAGCEKKEAIPATQEPPKAAASQPADMGVMVHTMTNDAQNAAMQMGNQATQAVNAVKKEADPLLNSLADKTNAVSSIADAATKVIEAAKKLAGENKYDEALRTLGTLTYNKLAPDQQKLVETLKEQIQKAMAAKATDSAAKAVGDLFKK